MVVKWLSLSLRQYSTRRYTTLYSLGELTDEQGAGGIRGGRNWRRQEGELRDYFTR